MATRDPQVELGNLKAAGNDLISSAPGDDLLDDLSSATKELRTKASVNAGRLGSSSIIGKAKDNLFEFPVFVSSTVSIQDITAVNGLLEQVYASYLQMAISMNPVTTMEDVKRGRVFSRYKTDNTKYLEYDLPFYSIDACSAHIVTEACECQFDRIVLPEAETKAIIESMEYIPFSEFSHYFQEASKPKDAEERVEDEQSTATFRKKVSEALGIPESEVPKNLNEAIDFVTGVLKSSTKNDEDPAAKTAMTEINVFVNRVKDAYTEETKRAKELEDDRKKVEDAQKALTKAEGDATHCENLHRAGQLDDETYKESKAELAKAKKEFAEARVRLLQSEQSFTSAQKEVREAQGFVFKTREHHKANLTDDQKTQREAEKHAFDMKAKAPVLLDESKVQKLNTMKPLMMSVNLKVLSGEKGSVVNNIDYVVGVKTHCRVVDAEILPEVVEYPTKTMNQLSRYAKWRAGEIRFLDFLFSRPEKKQAAYDSKDPKRKWYHRLYTLAHSKGSKGVAKRVTGKRVSEGVIPNATIVLSKADINNIKIQTKIDLMKASAARSLCQELFLMSLVVIDEDKNSLSILLPDINNDYDVQSISVISRQRETLENTPALLREMNKLGGK